MPDATTLVGRTPVALTVIKYAGAGYLLYLDQRS